MRKTLSTYTYYGLFFKALNRIIFENFCFVQKLFQRFKKNRVINTNRLLYPYNNNDNSSYCFASECPEDWKAIMILRRFLKKNITIYVASNNDLVKQFSLPNGINVITYDDIAKKKFAVVTIPTIHEESTIVDKLMYVYNKFGHSFSIWDPCNYLPTQRDEQLIIKRYRDVNLAFFQNDMVFPSYYANWSYINYLVTDIIKDGMDVLDMFAGSGCIGFSLKRESAIRSISFSEVNYLAVLSMRKTMECDKNLEGKVWLSDVFEGVPETNKFDLIVGNPPHGNKRIKSIKNIGGADLDWELHRPFSITHLNI